MPVPVRVVIATVGALLLVAILYAVGINVAFSTPLFERIANADPMMLDIHYRRGWSLLPGRIHADDLSIRGRDSNVEWILRIDHVEFDVSLWGLFRRRFDVSRVHGKGVSLRLRSRIDAQSLTTATLSDLPSIAGLRSIPVRPFRQCTKDDWSDADYHLWTIHLAHVIADDVREIWIDHERFDGRAKVTGGFYLKPVRAARVGPIHAEILDGGFTKGRTTQVEGLSGVSDVTVAEFDPRVTDADALLHRVSVGLDLRTYVPDVAHLPIRPPGGLRVHGAAEVPRLVVRVRNGVVMDETQLDARSPAISVAWADHQVTAAISITAEVRLSDDGERTTLTAHIADAQLDGAILRAPRVEVKGDTGAVDVARPFVGLRFAASADEIDLPDASALSRYLPDSPLPFRGGSARASVSAEFGADQRFDRLAVDLETRRLRLGNRDVDLLGDARGSVRVRDWRWSTGEMTLEQAALDIVAASVWLPRRGGSEPTLSIDRVSVGAHGARFVLSTAPANLSLSARVSGARLRDPSLRGRLDALANLDIEDSTQTARGDIQAVLSQATGRYKQTGFAGNARVVARIRGASPASGDFDVSESSLEVRDAQVVGPGTQTARWDANAVLSGATLHIGGGPPRFQGRLALQATNADPFLAVLVPNRWPQILGLTDQPHFIASARLTLGARLVALENVRVQFGDVTLRGLYGERDSLRRGAVTIARGPLSVGLRVDNDGAHVRLFGLRGWSQREETRVLELLRGPEERSGL
jgi:hypothetical protein